MWLPARIKLNCGPGRPGCRCTLRGTTQRAHCFIRKTTLSLWIHETRRHRNICLLLLKVHSVSKKELSSFKPFVSSLKATVNSDLQINPTSELAPRFSPCTHNWPSAEPHPSQARLPSLSVFLALHSSYAIWSNDIAVHKFGRFTPSKMCRDRTGSSRWAKIMLNGINWNEQVWPPVAT